MYELEANEEANDEKTQYDLAFTSFLQNNLQAAHEHITAYLSSNSGDVLAVNLLHEIQAKQQLPGSCSVAFDSVRVDAHPLQASQCSSRSALAEEDIIRLPD